MTEENEDKAAWVLEIMYLAEELCVFNYYSWVSHSLARKQGPQRECGAASAVMGRAREPQLPGGAGRNAPAAEEVKARQSMSSPEYFFICRRAEVMRYAIVDASSACWGPRCTSAGPLLCRRRRCSVRPVLRPSPLGARPSRQWLLPLAPMLVCVGAAAAGVLRGAWYGFR
jgi:hypothetical protein